MLRRVAKSALPLVLKTNARVLLTSFRPCFSFTTKNDQSGNLATIVQSQITHEQSSKSDLSELYNFFENQGWKIKLDGIQVELSKKNGPYNLRILFNARTPMMVDDQDPAQQQEQGQEQEPDQDFSEISAYVNKDGSSKWFALDFMVTNDSQAQLGTAAFIPDYEAEKNEKKKGRLSISGYSGPQLSSLDEKLQNSIYQFVESVGISGQILQRASQFSVSYEQQFYLEWLKDLKSLV